jgi:hypothetical protein
LHIRDGVDILQEFNNLKLAGAFCEKKLRGHKPGSLIPKPSGSNTLPLEKSHKVFSAIGISFYACAFEDFNVGGLRMTALSRSLSRIDFNYIAAGGQFDVEDDISPGCLV